MTTSIHITALDAIVNANSLFTLAVFLGLAWNPSDPTGTLTDPSDSTTCPPGPHIAESFVAFHVYSFSSFLFSSLVALALKQAIRISKASPTTRHRFPHVPEFLQAQINRNLLRIGMLVSGVGSVVGCVCLMLALVNLVQLKLGTLGCTTGSGHTYAAVVPLVILVPVALLGYVSVVLYAFTR